MIGLVRNANPRIASRLCDLEEGRSWDELGHPRQVPVVLNRAVNDHDEALLTAVTEGTHRMKPRAWWRFFLQFLRFFCGGASLWAVGMLPHPATTTPRIIVFLVADSY